MDGDVIGVRADVDRGEVSFSEVAPRHVALGWRLAGLTLTLSVKVGGVRTHTECWRGSHSHQQRHAFAACFASDMPRHVVTLLVGGWWGSHGATPQHQDHRSAGHTPAAGS